MSHCRWCLLVLLTGMRWPWADLPNLSSTIIFCRKMAGLLKWKFNLRMFSLSDRENSKWLGHKEQERETNVKMERFVCSSLPRPCWVCQPFLLPWVQWFYWWRNLGLSLHHLRSSWRSSFLAGTQHSHISCLISALQGPMSWRHHFILPCSSHISICGEQQLMCSWEWAK